MLIKVLDETGTPQSMIVNGQEALVDSSGTIATTNTSQIGVSANAYRTGFFFQNLGSHNMWVNELGNATEVAGSVLIAPGQSISAPYNYPVSVGAINVIGTSGDGYTIRTW